MIRSMLEKEVETRFQIILTLAILFPTFLGTVLGSIGEGNQQIANTTLIWSSSIGLLLLDYVIFSTGKSLLLPHWTLNLVRTLLIIGISLYIFPFIFLSTSKLDAPVSGWANYIGLQGSLWGLPIVPFAILIILVVGKISYLFSKNKV